MSVINSGTLLASGSTTSSRDSALVDMSDPKAQGGDVGLQYGGVVLFLNVTGTPNNSETLTLVIRAVHSDGTAVQALTAFTAILASDLGATPAAGSREFVYIVAPGATMTSAVTRTVVQAIPLPRFWIAHATHSSSGTWNYSLSYSLVR